MKLQSGSSRTTGGGPQVDYDDNDDDDDDNDNDDDDEVYLDISLINIAFFIPAVVVKTTFEGSECIYNALIVHKVCFSVAPNAFCLPLNFRNFIAVSRVVLSFLGNHFYLASRFDAIPDMLR